MMGACSIEVTASGKSMADAFKNAQEEAREEYGNDSYNGQINNCSLVSDCTPKERDFKSRSEFHDWIIETTSKREVKGYCVNKPIVNSNKIKTVVTNFPQKGARKWVTMYVGNLKYDNGVVCKDISQTACIRKAREYVEEHPAAKVDIEITKILIGGGTKVAEITYKKASNEKDGLYCFVGWAPE